jgi:hypothetical protein
MAFGAIIVIVLFLLMALGLIRLCKRLVHTGFDDGLLELVLGLALLAFVFWFYG